MNNILLELKKELQNYHRDKKELETYYINNRLNESLVSYYKDLQYSYKYLDYRKSENVFKKLGD